MILSWHEWYLRKLRHNCSLCTVYFMPVNNQNLIIKRIETSQMSKKIKTFQLLQF